MDASSVPRVDYTKMDQNPGILLLRTFAFKPTVDSSKRGTWEDQLREVLQVHASAGAFAALRADGVVVTWGHTHMGGRNARARHANFSFPFGQGFDLPSGQMEVIGVFFRFSVFGVLVT